jgi:putative transposase
LRLVDEAVGAGARQEAAAEIVGLPVRTLQRWREQGEGGGEDRRQGPLTPPANKLRPEERTVVLQTANAPEYRDVSPKQIVPRLADANTYLASESTFYRVLREEDQLAHRERSRPATARRPEERVATGPNQIWAWDITYLSAPIRGTFFFLYLILDIWSRKIVGAAVYDEENSVYASQLFLKTCLRHDLDPGALVLHSDNGGPMKGATMLATLRWLGVTASFSRPHVSDDNAFAEALFRTLKYCPAYPSQPFASLDEARGWVEAFVHWYNTQHLHSAIRYVTPDARHYGLEDAILANRRRVYEEARQRHPERWSGAVRDWTPVAEVRLCPRANPVPQSEVA